MQIKYIINGICKYTHLYKKSAWIWLTLLIRENCKCITRTVIGSRHDLLTITAGVTDCLCISVSLCNTQTVRNYHGLFVHASAGCVSDQLHPASSFKTAFDLDILSRVRSCCCQRLNAHIFDRFLE